MPLPARPTAPAAPRRRIYLMRHGAVDYFRPDGTPVPPATVSLSAAGAQQARAAGALFGASAVRFDRVVTSGLARTVQTAQLTLEAAGQSAPIESVPAFEEIRPGRLADIPAERLREAFIGAFSAGGSALDVRFLGGESIGELLDRVLPAFDALLAASDWTQLLLVLHGGVNRALIARALTGQRAFFGAVEQVPACINIIDVGNADMVVRAVNLAPERWLQHDLRATTMEQLLAEYLHAREG